MICIFSFLARDEGIWQLGIEVGTLMKNHLFHDLFNLPQVDCLYMRESSVGLYPIVHHVARFHAVRPLCLSEYHVEDVMVLKCPFSRVMTQSDGVLIVFISREGAISSRNNKA